MLVSYRTSQVTPDTAEALRQLERAASKVDGARIHYKGVKANEATWKGVQVDPGPTGLPPYLSMRPTGREVYLSLSLDSNPDPAKGLEALWALAVPLGFMPWCRYPLPGPLASVFHYLGPWAGTIDFLHGEGRGELAWPSACCAAQVIEGKWEGDRLVERSIQAHLHRLGVYCGPVDGEIGETTLRSLRALGLGGKTSQESLDVLKSLADPPPAGGDRQPVVGHFAIKGVRVEAFSSGSVNTTRTRTGFSVTVQGEGRLVLLFGD